MCVCVCPLKDTRIFPQDHGLLVDDAAAMAAFLLPVLARGAMEPSDAFPHLPPDKTLLNFFLHEPIQNMSSSLAKAARRVRKAQAERAARTSPKGNHQRLKRDQLQSIHRSRVLQ